jgi:hypothetical protein
VQAFLSHPELFIVHFPLIINATLALLEDEIPALQVCLYHVTIPEVTLHDFPGQGCFYQILYGSFQWTGTEVRVVSLLCDV